MANAELSQVTYRTRAIALTDYLLGLNLTAVGADAASSLDTLMEIIRKVYVNPPPDLTDAEKTALKSALGITAQQLISTQIGTDQQVTLISTAWHGTGITLPTTVNEFVLRIDLQPVRGLYLLSGEMMRSLTYASLGAEPDATDGVPVARAYFYDISFQLCVGILSTMELAIAYGGLREADFFPFFVCAHN